MAQRNRRKPVWLPGRERRSVVVQAFGPGPAAKHRLWGYGPDREHTQRLIDHVYRESDSQLRYLGDWHTHPRGVARPSGRDSTAARTIANDPGPALPAPVVLIQATSAHGRKVRLGELGGFLWDTKEETLRHTRIRPFDA